MASGDRSSARRRPPRAACPMVVGAAGDRRPVPGTYVWNDGFDETPRVALHLFQTDGEGDPRRRRASDRRSRSRLNDRRRAGRRLHRALGLRSRFLLREDLRRRCRAAQRGRPCRRTGWRGRLGRTGRRPSRPCQRLARHDGARRLDTAAIRGIGAKGELDDALAAGRLRCSSRIGRGRQLRRRAGHGGEHGSDGGQPCDEESGKRLLHGDTLTPDR